MAGNRMLIQGMHGMGDNVHQRAIVRYFLEHGYSIDLETSWVSMYHDMLGPKLRLVRKPTHLRTQTKNAEREAGLFAAPIAGRDRGQAFDRVVKVHYRPDTVRRLRGVLAAMCDQCGVPLEGADFRLPVPEEWKSRAMKKIGGPFGKPIMVYRPLVDRPSDWGGCNARNPDHEAYFTLAGNAARAGFHVVSVADLEPGKEWEVGIPFQAHVTLHKGELAFEELAGLLSVATLAFGSPGFIVPLSQAVGTAVVCVFGGYEQGYSFSAGRKFAPYLPINPVHPCDCFSHTHKCDKTINLDEARYRVNEFANAIANAIY